MDYKIFYSEVADWIYQCNQKAIENGLGNESFWLWVATSLGELSNKYGNNPLVNIQTTMLFQWLEEVCEKSKE
jgi:hypothetical protein